MAKGMIQGGNEFLKKALQQLRRHNLLEKLSELGKMKAAEKLLEKLKNNSLHKQRGSMVYLFQNREEDLGNKASIKRLLQKLCENQLKKSKQAMEGLKSNSQDFYNRERLLQEKLKNLIQKAYEKSVQKSFFKLIENCLFRQKQEKVVNGSLK